MLPGLVAFRQHLQNLARTKGILELNKVQMLVEQMGSGEGAAIGPLGPQHHLHNLLEVSSAAQSHKHTHILHSDLFMVRLFPNPLSRCYPHPVFSRKKIKQTPRLLCNPARGSQLWLVYCLPSPWGLEPGA